MDLMAAIETFRSSPEQVRARAARRELRGQVFARLAEALGRSSACAVVDGELEELHRLTREAAGWNLPVDGEVEDGHSIGHQHPGAAALLIVRQSLAEYRIPTEVDLRYHGMRRTSGHGSYGMNDGIVYVQATLHSISGPRHHIDIPVIVRQGRVLAPSILLHNGNPRVITQNTLDDIIGMGEFTAKIPDRPNMFAPGPDKGAARPRREVPRLAPNMFKPLPSRSLIGSAVRGVVQQAALSPDQTAMRFVNMYEHDIELGEFVDMNEVASSMREQAAREFMRDAIPSGFRPEHNRERIIAEARAFADEVVAMALPEVEHAFTERQAFYAPDETGVLENGSLGKDVPGAGGSHLDVGERPTKGQFGTGQRVRLKSEATARDRGGVRYTIPRGTRGTVVRDVDGADRVYYVRFEELGFAASVPKEALSG